MTEKPTLPLATTADMIGIKAGTLRRWCVYHHEYLSTTANPLAGVPRRFTYKDIEVLRMVAELRSQGLTVGGINDRLSAITFPDVEESEVSDDNTELAIVDAPESPQSTQAIVVALQAMQTQIDSLQRVSAQHQGDTVKGFAIGFLVAGFLFLGMVLLSWLYGGG